MVGSYRREVVAPVLRRAARRIVVHPLLWLGVVGSVVLAVVEGRPAYPRALIGGWTLPADVGLFAAVHLTAGRRQTDGAVTTWEQRTCTAALLLGATGVALAIGMVSLTVVSLLMGPLDVFDGWWPHPLELAQTVTVPLVLGVLAVATARWWPHPAAGLAVLVVLLFTPMSWALDLHHVTGRGGWVPTDRARSLPASSRGICATTSASRWSRSGWPSCGTIGAFAGSPSRWRVRSPSRSATSRLACSAPGRHRAARRSPGVS
jgi:hypothetical protein